MLKLQKRLPKWRQHFVKTYCKRLRYLSKSSKFRTVRTIQICLNSNNMWSKCLSNNVWREFRLQMSVLVMVAAGKKIAAGIEASPVTTFLTVSANCLSRYFECKKLLFSVKCCPYILLLDHRNLAKV